MSKKQKQEGVDPEPGRITTEGPDAADVIKRKRSRLQRAFEAVDYFNPLKEKADFQRVFEATDYFNPSKEKKKKKKKKK